MIENYNIHFAVKRKHYFAVFNSNGIMENSNNTGVALLFKGKDVNSFILYCAYNDFRIWT